METPSVTTANLHLRKESVMKKGKANGRRENHPIIKRIL